MAQWLRPTAPPSPHSSRGSSPARSDSSDFHSVASGSEPDEGELADEPDRLLADPTFEPAHPPPAGTQHGLLTRAGAKRAALADQEAALALQLDAIDAVLADFPDLPIGYEVAQQLLRHGDSSGNTYMASFPAGAALPPPPPPIPPPPPPQRGRLKRMFQVQAAKLRRASKKLASFLTDADEEAPHPQGVKRKHAPVQKRPLSRIKRQIQRLGRLVRLHKLSLDGAGAAAILLDGAAWQDYPPIEGAVHRSGGLPPSSPFLPLPWAAAAAPPQLRSPPAAALPASPLYAATAHCAAAASLPCRPTNFPSGSRLPPSNSYVCVRSLNSGCLFPTLATLPPPSPT